MASDFFGQIPKAIRRGSTGLRASLSRFGEEATGLDFFEQQRLDAEADLARPDLQPRVKDLRSAVQGPNPVADTAELIALGGAEALPSFAMMAAGGITGRILGGLMN